MPWVLVDVAFAVFALLALGAVGFSVFRHVRTLLGTVKHSSAALADLTPGLQVTKPVGPER